MSEREHREALREQAAQAQAAADQAARAAALAELPCKPEQLLALFDRLDAVLDDGCHHDWRESQAWAHAQGVDWQRMQAWMQARSADSTDDVGDSGEVDCDCAVWIYVRPSWTDVLVRAAGLPQAQVTLFPELDEVFHDPTPLMACLFLPLISVDLPSLGLGAGCVHAVSVYESGTPEHEWLPPELDYDRVQFDWDGTRYRFRGDLSQLERLHPLLDWHAEAQALYQSYALDAEAFRGMLACQTGPWQSLQDTFQHHAKQAYTQGLWREADKLERIKSRYLIHLIGYWLARDACRATGRLIPGGAYLMKGHSPHERAPHGHLLRSFQATDEGQGWQKIGSLVGHNFVDNSEDCIQLHLSREGGQVLQRFEWS